jgi:hypothetical protein
MLDEPLVAKDAYDNLTSYGPSRRTFDKGIDHSYLQLAYLQLAQVQGLWLSFGRASAVQNSPYDDWAPRELNFCKRFAPNCKDETTTTIDP